MAVRFPFTPSVLDSLPEELAELFRGLEMDLLQQICSRLNAADQLNEVTVDAIRALRSHGIDLKDIEKAIKDTTGISQKKLDKLLDDVVERNQTYYREIITLAKVTEPEALVDQADIDAIKAQCQREFGNITRSMGFLVDNGKTMLKPAQCFQHCLDAATLKIQSGAISYNEAIRQAVRELADSGLKTVDYASGHTDSVDVAVRRAVQTGVNALNAKYREQSMDYLNTDLVEVSAHLGARNIQGPNIWDAHTNFQGRVFRWKGHGKQAKEPKDDQQDPKPQEVVQKTATSQKSAKRSVEPQDVTEEYIKNATPRQGEITYDDKYDQAAHTKEVDFAQWIKNKLGGSIRLLNEVNGDHVKTPDYMWNRKMWDLKTVSTEKAADAAIRHGLKQIYDNPGGIFLDYRGRSIDLKKLKAIIDNRMRHRKNDLIDILIVLDGDIKVWRYKK